MQDGLEVYLPMAGLVDKEKERARLEKQAEKLSKDAEALENRLAGSNFVEKVRVRVRVCVRNPGCPIAKFVAFLYNRHAHATL